MTTNPLAFLVSSSALQRRALAASTLGWMLDGMGVTLTWPDQHRGKALGLMQSGFAMGAIAARGGLVSALQDRCPGILPGRNFCPPSP